jgi:DNA-binding transcriptional MerR regulator
MGLTVGQVAELASISVRTLHHYDELGLLVPSVRTDAGYRLYADADLVTLQQVLFFKELGFSLADIARIMNVGCSQRSRRNWL